MKGAGQVLETGRQSFSAVPAIQGASSRRSEVASCESGSFIPRPLAPTLAPDFTWMNVAHYGYRKRCGRSLSS